METYMSRLTGNSSAKGILVRPPSLFKIRIVWLSGWSSFCKPRRYCLTTGRTTALAEAVTVRSYSPASGSTCAEQMVSTSGPNSSLTISATLRSCSSLQYELIRLIVTASGFCLFSCRRPFLKSCSSIGVTTLPSTPMRSIHCTVLSRGTWVGIKG